MLWTSTSSTTWSGSTASGARRSSAGLLRRRTTPRCVCPYRPLLRGQQEATLAVSWSRRRPRCVRCRVLVARVAVALRAASGATAAAVLVAVGHVPTLTHRHTGRCCRRTADGRDFQLSYLFLFAFSVGGVGGAWHGVTVFLCPPSPSRSRGSLPLSAKRQGTRYCGSGVCFRCRSICVRACGSQHTSCDVQRGSSCAWVGGGGGPRVIGLAYCAEVPNWRFPIDGVVACWQASPFCRCCPPTRWRGRRC